MYQNAMCAFQDGLEQILKNGQIVVVRGQQVTELRSHLVTIERPLERAYVIPYRKNNIFAMIAETIWVIAGHNDIEYLSYYLRRAKDYSDDNKTWRGAYGPRLRNWDGTDQFREVVKILKDDPQSRRAVMVIYDPAKDLVDSKDIPCNNWLHFIKRNDILHMNAVIRSNDVMWGFSGINTFEWSVLHEMMSFWTNSQVGSFTYFISSFHLYDRHYERAKQILSNIKEKSIYDFGFYNIPFQTSFNNLDIVLNKWFLLEKDIRQGTIQDINELNVIHDEFLNCCLKMLFIYNKYIKGASIEDIDSLLRYLPVSDYRIAAIEYLTRDNRYRNELSLSPQENAYLQYYNAESPNIIATSDYYTVDDIFRLLSVLHDKKTIIYKDSWKKHCEVVSIFANISRKYDRIESIIEGGAIATLDETLIDTIGDLAVYSIKYLTYLAEFYTKEFQEFLKICDIEESNDKYSSSVDGFENIISILLGRINNSVLWNKEYNYNYCNEQIKLNYKSLENILIHGNWRDNSADKCIYSSDIAISSALYLSLVSKNEPAKIRKFAETIKKL